MQPGRARTSGLGVPLLPLARWVGWVAPVRPTHGVLVLSCPSAALRVCSVLGRWAPVHRCARAVCCGASRCPGPAGSFSPVCSLGVLCCMCGVLGHWAPVHRCACCVRCACAMGGCVPLPPTLIFVFFFFYLFFFFFGKKKEKKMRKTGARVHCRHRHGQLVRRCNSVVSSGVCRRCCGGGRAPGVRLACPDVHGYGSGWVWLGVSLLLVLAG